MLSLLPPDHRGQDEEAGALLQAHNLVHNLVNGLAADLLATFGAVGHPHPGPQQAKVIVNLRHRAHGRAGVLGGGLLVNGNGGRQAVDGVHIRLVHLAQKLPGVGRQGLHIPPLPLGIDGIKGQGGLAGPGQASKHHQPVPGDDQVHILQIVFPGSVYDELVVHWVTSHRTRKFVL